MPPWQQRDMACPGTTAEVSISARLFKVGVWPCPSREAAGFRHVLVVASVLIFRHVISRQRIRRIALFRSMMRVRGRGLRGPPARTSLTAIARGGDTCGELWTHSTAECKEARMQNLKVLPCCRRIVQCLGEYLWWGRGCRDARRDGAKGCGATVAPSSIAGGASQYGAGQKLAAYECPAAYIG